MERNWGLFLTGFNLSLCLGLGSGWRANTVGVGRGNVWNQRNHFLSLVVHQSGTLYSKQLKEIGAHVIFASLGEALTLFMPLIFYLASNCCLIACLMKYPGVEIRFGPWICISDSWWQSPWYHTLNWALAGAGPASSMEFFTHSPLCCCNALFGRVSDCTLAPSIIAHLSPGLDLQTVNHCEGYFAEERIWAFS